MVVRMGKRLRDERRREGPLSASLQAEMVRESQFQKAELHRTKQRYALRDEELARRLQPFESRLQTLRSQRKERSEALQRWLFSQFEMLNGEGVRRSLLDIFAATPQAVPPSGAGECCEPKLLQYAFAHDLRPLQMAMFWYGPSPGDEVRHHLQCYPACRGKCKPILEWMLSLPAVSQPSPACGTPASVVTDLFISPSSTPADGYLVVHKPAGLLSVPGTTDAPSVFSILREQLSGTSCCGAPYMVHRLDQDTSGLLVVALTKRVQQQLQQQFERREVDKVYEAELERPVLTPGQEGDIRLPLLPDPLNRPYQRVDFEQGREAVTHYKALTPTRIELHPLTGRTHQLRVHCAHQQGLGCPIKGDRLYGHRPDDGRAERLHLHARTLTFTDPGSGIRRTFEWPPEF